jgi:ribose 1,5-bisphosphokinase
VTELGGAGATGPGAAGGVGPGAVRAGAGAGAVVGVGPGAVVAVVGASGVGKDALIGAARTRLGTAAVFPRRVVTRPPGPGEDHEPMDEATFAEADARGDFAAQWRAHGLRYGLRASIDDDVRAGRTVVANVSRGVLDALDARYAHLVVVRVSVSDAVRAERLRARNREPADEVARRLARADPAPDHRADVEIRNDGSVAQGGAQLAGVVLAVGGGVPEGSLPAAPARSAPGVP